MLRDRFYVATFSPECLTPLQEVARPHPQFTARALVDAIARLGASVSDDEDCAADLARLRTALDRLGRAEREAFCDGMALLESAEAAF